MTIKAKVVEFLTQSGETIDKTENLSEIYKAHYDKYPEFFDKIITRQVKKKYNIPVDATDSDPELTDYNPELDNYFSDSGMLETATKIHNYGKGKERQPPEAPESGPSPDIVPDVVESDTDTNETLINPPDIAYLTEQMEMLTDKVKHLSDCVISAVQDIILLKQEIKHKTGNTYNLNFS